jgi:hypothetical protein
MKNKRTKSTVLISIVVIFSMLISNITVSAYGIWFTGGYRPVPAYVVAYSGFANESKDAIDNACTAWNSAGAGNIIYRTIYDHNNEYFPDDPGYIDNDQSEIARSYIVETYTMQTRQVSIYWEWHWHLTEADIVVNMYYPWTNLPDPNSDVTHLDVGDVMTHELGHVLGLAHSDVTGATMKQGSEYGRVDRRSIEQDDKNGIAYIY